MTTATTEPTDLEEMLGEALEAGDGQDGGETGKSTGETLATSNTTTTINRSTGFGG